MNASDEQLLDSDYRRCLIATLFTAKPDVQSCLSLVRQIGHRLDTTDALIAPGLLSVLAALFSEAQSVFDDREIGFMKQLLFADSGVLKHLALAHNVDNRVYVVLEELLQSSFRPTSSADRCILSQVSAHWLTLLLSQLDCGDLDVSCLCKFDDFLDLIASANRWTRVLSGSDIFLLRNYSTCLTSWFQQGQSPTLVLLSSRSYVYSGPPYCKMKILCMPYRNASHSFGKYDNSSVHHPSWKNLS